jgi:lipopolysaccharide biosynthesis glycosyltransferase
MDIVMQSSDSYSKFLIVAAASLFESNMNEKITLHVFSDGIKEENINEIENLEELYLNAKIIFYDTKNMVERLDGRVNKFHGSFSTYLKLFIPEVIPQNISRVLYLDVDILVMDSIKELFTIDMKGNCIAGVESIIDKNNLIDERDNNKKFHINGGVVLFDLEKCRDTKVIDKFIGAINELGSKINFADQSIIHATLLGEIYKLDIKYNVVTPAIFLDYDRFLSIYNLHNYYDKETYENAVSKPVIVHCTSWLTGRPWEVLNSHPYKETYSYFLNKLGISINIENPDFLRTIRKKIILCIYKFAPYNIFRKIIKLKS